MSENKLSPVAASGAEEPDENVPSSRSSSPATSTEAPTADNDRDDRDDRDADEDPTYARKDLVDLLDTHFYDESCSSLSQCLRSLPSENIDVHELRDLIFRVSNIPRSKSVSSDDWRRCVALFSLEVLKRLHVAVMHTLLEELNALTEHVEYWQGQQGSPMLHYLKKGPKHWWRNSPTGIFSSGLKPWLGYVAYLQRNEVEEILHNLDLIQKGFLTQVGQTYNTLQLLNRTEDLKTEIESFVGSAEALFLFLSGKEARRVKGPFKFLVVLSDICSAIPEFKLRVKFSMIPLKKPSHLRRYWITYTVGVTAGAVISYRAYQHRELIATYMRRSFESLRFFIADHIIEPITKIYHHVFVTLRQRNANATAHSLRQNREALSNMLLDFGKENADYNASKEGVPVSTYLQTLPNRSAEGDMSIVLPRYEQEVQKPVRAAVTGHLVRGLLIQVQKVKTDTEAAIITLDQVMEANELNFQLLALIPALLGLVFVGYTTKRLLYRRSARDQKLRAKISRQLHRIELLLIQSYAKDKLDDTELGQLLLQVYLLEQWSRKCMPQEKLTAFLEDLDRLKAHDLTPEQKMLIVQRLYRSNRRLLQE